MTADDGFNLVAAGPSRAHLRAEHLLEGCPVVTVNRALDISDRIKVHFAAIADGPDGFWNPLGFERYVKADPTIQLWVTLRQLTRKQTIHRHARWKSGVPDPHFLKAALKVLPQTAHKALVSLAEKYLMHPAESFDINAPGPQLIQLWDRALPAIVGVRLLPHGDVIDVHNKNATREAFTTLCALDRIWMFRPKKVRILCCDMAGTWIEGKTEQECHEFEQKKFDNKQTLAVLDRWAHERYALDESIKLAKETFGVEVDWVTPQGNLTSPEAIPSLMAAGSSGP